MEPTKTADAALLAITAAAAAKWPVGERDRWIVCRLDDGYSGAEVARVLGITRERVSQLAAHERRRERNG
jgi:DNA-directed RNA polymerase specialized sigma subunit